MINHLEDKNLYINGQTFCRLYELGSFSGVAKKFNISQSTVSRRIIDLESTLAKTLIKRNTRSVEFTNDGRRFYEFFKQHESSFEQIIGDFVNENKDKKTTIKMSIPYGTANLILTPKIPEYIANHENLTLQLKHQTRRVDMFRENFDIVIQRERPVNKTFHTYVLPVPYLYLYCTPEYIKQYGKPSTTEEFKNHFIIGAMTYEKENLKEWGVINPEGAMEYVEVRQRLNISNIEPSSMYVESNEVMVIGIDEMYKDQLASNRLVKVMPEYKFLNKPLYLVVNNENRHPLVMDFVKYIINIFNTYNKKDKITNVDYSIGRYDVKLRE